MESSTVNADHRDTGRPLTVRALAGAAVGGLVGAVLTYYAAVQGWSGSILMLAMPFIYSFSGVYTNGGTGFLGRFVRSLALGAVLLTVTLLGVAVLLALFPIAKPGTTAGQIASMALFPGFFTVILLRADRRLSGSHAG